MGSVPDPLPHPYNIQNLQNTSVIHNHNFKIEQRYTLYMAEAQVNLPKGTTLPEAIFYVKFHYPTQATSWLYQRGALDSECLVILGEKCNIGCN